MKTPFILWVCMVLVWAASAFFAISGDFARAAYAMSSCLFIALLMLTEAIRTRPLKINIDNTVNGEVNLSKVMIALADEMKRIGLGLTIKKKEKK